MWIDQQDKRKLISLRHLFLSYLPKSDYFYNRISSDNKQKIDKLFTILNTLENIILSLRKSKETTLEALGKVNLDHLFDKLQPIILNKFSFNLSMIPRISIKDIKIYKEDEFGNLLDVDLVFEIQGYIKDNLFTIDYPLYIVDGYIRDPEIVYFRTQRYSLKDFLELMQSDMLEPAEPIPMMQFINERGNEMESLWSKSEPGLESMTPTQHVWSPFKYK